MRSFTCTSNEDTSQRDDIYNTFANDWFCIHIDIVNWSQIHDFENNNEIMKKLNELLNLLQITNMWLLEILHTMFESKIIDNVIINVESNNVE